MSDTYRSSSTAFQDDRIFLVAPDDDRLVIYYDPASTAAGLQQDRDGPGYLVIGPNVQDSSLEKVSSRFGMPIDGLVAFREMIRQGGNLDVRHG